MAVADLFQEATPALAARAQLPNAAGFQGRVAFNPAADLSADEMYLMAVHELGHLLGLQHNPSAWSVMYFLGLEGPVALDLSDLAVLTQHHKLRGEGTGRVLPVVREAGLSRVQSPAPAGIH